jgi:membrane protein
MFWMQISWVVVLFGAELAFANQNIEQYEYETESLHMSARNRRLVTLYITHLIVRNFENGALPLNAKQISKKLRLPIRLTRDILNDLVRSGYCRRCAPTDKGTGISARYRYQ